jgi:MOSC domain-containing protein YiiM
MDGKIENLFLKVGHGEPMSPVRELSADSGAGIVGDKSYGRKKRQVLLIEKEILDEFSLEPGWVRENITVSHITLTGLEPGRLLQAGGVSLEITGDCTPCQLIDDIKPGLRTEMEKRRGILCIVKDGGKMKVGDRVRLIS